MEDLREFLNETNDLVKGCLTEAKVVGSAGSLDALVELIQKKQHWKEVDLEELEKEKHWAVSNAKFKNLGEIKKKGNRYQFFWTEDKKKQMPHKDAIQGKVTSNSKAWPEDPSVKGFEIDGKYLFPKEKAKKLGIKKGDKVWYVQNKDWGTAIEIMKID